MLYKIRFVFFRYIRHWGCKLLFINAVQYIFILLVPIRFVLGVVLDLGDYGLPFLFSVQ